MTAGELIKKLNKLDPKTEINIAIFRTNTQPDYYDFADIEDFRLDKEYDGQHGIANQSRVYTDKNAMSLLCRCGW